SRRQHTKSKRDWSSDVCSSDLNQLNDYYNGNDHELDLEKEMERIAIRNNFDILIKDEDNINIYSTSADFYYVIDSIIGAGTSKRSEERRVGKEYRYRREQKPAG